MRKWHLLPKSENRQEGDRSEVLVVNVG